MIVTPFGLLHLSMLAMGVGMAFVFRLLLKNRSEVFRRNFLAAFCGAGFVIFWIYKFAISVDVPYARMSGYETFNWFTELPLHLCNINLMLIPVAVLGNRRFLKGFCFSTAPIGALMAMLFPANGFAGFSLLVPRVTGYYVTHMMIITAGLCLVTLDLYRPRVKDIPGVLLVFVSLAGLMTCVNCGLRRTGLCPTANYMYTLYHNDISILKLFWSWIPVPFLYELPAIGILLGYIGIASVIFKWTERKKS